MMSVEQIKNEIHQTMKETAPNLYQSLLNSGDLENDISIRAEYCADFVLDLLAEQVLFLKEGTRNIARQQQEEQVLEIKNEAFHEALDMFTDFSEEESCLIAAEEEAEWERQQEEDEREEIEDICVQVLNLYEQEVREKKLATAQLEVLPKNETDVLECDQIKKV